MIVSITFTKGELEIVKTALEIASVKNDLYRKRMKKLARKIKVVESLNK